MISRQKERFGWEFLFLAANIDAVETAGRFGIAPDRAVNYRADRRGTQVVYDTVCDAVSQVRSCAPLSDNWSEAIDADYNSRE